MRLRSARRGNICEIWGREFRLVRCPDCGEYFATEEQLEKADTCGGAGVPDLCPRCRKRDEAGRIKPV
ncbi:hypothetical protein [Methanogenium cariaci]|uniref:hypothetical protein n=1 Tax=Methanogenium cariaci TaxID=2197 RepID=UPI001C46068B|nr:hypothetical protein [Methanogenium cariaci]